MDEITIIKVPLSSVHYRSNYRQAYNEQAVQDYAANMAQFGYDPTYPMKVYRDGSGYTVIDGNTRYHAAQLGSAYDIKTHAPLMDVWIAVWPEPVGGEFVMQQIEANKSRNDTDPVSDGIGYKQAFGAGIPLAEIARRAHTTVNAVNTRIALLSLIPEVQEMVIKGHIGVSFAESMSTLDTNRQRIALSTYSKAQSPSLASFKDLCQRLYAEQIAESQTSFLGLFTADEIAARAEAEAEALVGVPKKSLKQLEAELEAERKARRNDRAYAIGKMNAALLEIARLKTELYGKELAA